MENYDLDYREVVISSINIALLDLLDDSRKARLMDAICARLKGKDPQGLDEATRIVFESISRDNEKVRLITKSSLVKMDTTVNQERLKEKVDANASTKEKKERKTSPLMADAFVFDAFQDWEKMRKQIKKPLTDLAKTRAVNKLEKLSGGDKDKAIAILEQSTDHCWQDLYELKTEDEPPAKTADLPPNRSAKVQTAYGFGTERKDVDYNKMVWERIRQGWAEQEQEGEE